MASRLAGYLRPSLAPVWLLLPVVGAIVGASLEPIPPHDYWWPLVMGRLIDATHIIPQSNIFLYTMPRDASFMNQPWLAQWIMYRVHDAFGHAGGVWLRNLLLAAAWGGALKTMWRRAPHPMVVGACALVCVMLTLPVVTVRTQMFAFLPFAALLYTVFSAAYDAQRLRLLFWNIPLMMFWVNAHGTFVLAPVLLAAATAAMALEQIVGASERSWRNLAMWGGATLLTGLSAALNPHGFKIYGYVLLLSMQSDVSSTVSEWQPPSWLEPIGQVYIVVLVGATALIWRARKHLRVFETVFFAAGVVLASSAVRNLFWFAMITAVVVAPILARQVAPPNPQHNRLNAFLVAALLSVVIAIQPGVLHQKIVASTTEGLARRSDDGQGILSHENATAALRAVHERLPDARVFHDQALGGLLEWSFTSRGPEQVAFVDQRMELIPQHVWDAYFEGMSGSGWREVLENHQVNVVIVRTDEQWPLVQRLSRDSAWAPVFADEVHLVFVRRDLLTRWRSAPT